MSDWTVNPVTGRSNDSLEFNHVVGEVERLIQDSAYQLIRGNAHDVARLIVAQLAHKHGLAPTGPKGSDGE